MPTDPRRSTFVTESGLLVSAGVELMWRAIAFCFALVALGALLVR